MKIAVDAMGGDFAPVEIVKGAVLAAGSIDADMVLVGRTGDIENELRKHAKAQGIGRISIAQAGEVIEMHEHPAMAVKSKKDSSVVVGLKLVASGQASAFVSAGNSGAVMAASLFTLGRIRGVERPGLGAVYPTAVGRTFLIDAGAVTECEPLFLLQFAHMGSLYMEKVFGIAKPKVGLLSNGEEATKGNQLVLKAHELLRESSLNFVGNVEGKDLPLGTVDVLVTDGFTGNVALKVSEGVSEVVIRMVKDTITSKWYYRLAAMVLFPPLRRLVKKIHFTEHGGVPLLGVNGVAIVAHGRSDARAVMSAIRAAKQAVEQGMVPAISEGIGEATKRAAEKRLAR